MPGPPAYRKDPLMYIFSDSSSVEEFTGEVSWFEELISYRKVFWKPYDSSFDLPIIVFDIDYLNKHSLLELAITTMCSLHMY